MDQVRGGWGRLERVLKNKVVCGSAPFGRGVEAKGSRREIGPVRHGCIRKVT